VPEHDDRPGTASYLRRLGEGVAVVAVGEHRLGLVDPHPGDPVDLLVGPVAAHVVVADRAAHPVVDGLAPAPDRVALRGQRRAEPDVEAGLLGDLADRGCRRVLPALELALGEGPVVVLRSVDEQHLAAGTERHHSRRADVRGRRG
jgi:hypothetical protein